MSSTNPQWMYEGQTVYVSARLVIPDAKPTTGLRCTVVAAHGNHARVVNEEYNFNRLMSKWDLWVKN